MVDLSIVHLKDLVDMGIEVKDSQNLNQVVREQSRVENQVNGLRESINRDLNDETEFE